MTRRVVSVLVLFAVLCSFLADPLGTTAQEASPAAGPATGAPVTLYGPDGAENGQITLVEFVDPFEAYDANIPPDHGFHFVLAHVSIQNTGARPLQIDANAFRLLDVDGYLTSPRGINRGQDVAEPDLRFSELGTGDTISGVVGFQALNGVALTSLVFMPDSERLITVAALGDASAPPAGAVASVLGAEGAEIASVAIGQVVDPFDGYDPGSAPERGSHFVMLDISVTNTSPRPARVDPGAFFLLDADGFLYRRANVFRGNEPAEPDFEYQDPLAPGAEASGLIGFQVLNGVQLVSIVYRPNSDRLITVADLTAG